MRKKLNIFVKIEIFCQFLGQQIKILIFMDVKISFYKLFLHNFTL